MEEDKKEKEDEKPRIGSEISFGELCINATEPLENVEKVFNRIWDKVIKNKTTKKEYIG